MYIALDTYYITDQGYFNGNIVYGMYNIMKYYVLHDDKIRAVLGHFNVVRSLDEQLRCNAR